MVELKETDSSRDDVKTPNGFNKSFRSKIDCGLEINRTCGRSTRNPVPLCCMNCDLRIMRF